MPPADSPAVRGGLITITFAASGLEAVRGAGPPPADTARAIDRWCERREAALGPASSVRAITDVAVVPLLSILGFVATEHRSIPVTVLEATAATVRVPVVVTAWGESLDRRWRALVLEGVRFDARWCLCCNGTSLRVVDAGRTWTRHYLEFDLSRLATDSLALRLLWSVLRAAALAQRPPAIEMAAELSARHAVTLCRELARGVLSALATLVAALPARLAASPGLFDQSLTVVYRILFLLFAEARGLVPLWHPVYRDRYSIDTIVAALAEGRRCRGLWQALQAISRLAHAGCSAGELKVTAFNGRLFSPAHAAAFDRVRIGDEALRDAILAVSTTTRTGGSRARISYRDLDVEQLGAVYEQVLGDARKDSASFYTPRALTSWLVRQTLGPLVRGRTADEILRLRVLDPAMGSGAFLVAACRYLAAAVEDALVREGRWHEADVAPAERALLRRTVAQRCLFGVDLNPMAVQLARLSLWLTTLASDKPLTFLDHHLSVGNSLVGATPADLQRQPPGAQHRRGRLERLPLFEAMTAQPALEQATQTRLRLALQPDDTAWHVRDKERSLAALEAAGTPLAAWRQVLSLWCAGWFWPEGPLPSPGVFGALCDRILTGRSSLPDHTAAPWLARGSEAAIAHAFLHWPFAFPEVFFDERGDARADGGFDAIVGNPPWDMVRGDGEAHHLTAFARESGIYRVESRAHANLYQLFLERSLQLVRHGGRVGLVLPGGVVTDSGAAGLRRHLFESADVDHLAGFDNRRAIFPIHRSMKFVLLTCTAGRPTRALACRFGLTTADELERIDDAVLTIPRPLLERLSGADDLGVPELTTARDLALVEKISARVPWLGAPEGWQARFGRELNATDDRDRFVRFAGRPGSRPVLEGKQIEPFRATLSTARYELKPGAAAPEAPARPRLAYRDVASATNRLTLIAAIVPSRAVTTHTLFCLKSPLPADAQHVLCALLNSLVANYLIRMRVNTHVTAALVHRLPVPVLAMSDPRFRRLRSLARALAAGTTPAEQMPEYADLQALVARSYGLTRDDFARVLETFPLLPDEMKAEALLFFDDSH